MQKSCSEPAISAKTKSFGLYTIMLSIGVWTFLRVHKQVVMNMSMARDPRGVKVKTTFFSTPSHHFFFTYTKHPIYIDVVRNLHIQSIPFTLMMSEYTMNHCNNTLNHCKSPMWWPRCRHVYSCDMVPVYPGEVESSTTIVTNYKTYMSLSPHVACWITCIQPRLYNVCQEELQKKRVDITISILQ